MDNKKNGALIDLHLHLDGSLSPETVRELAALAGVPVAQDDAALLEKLQVGEDCRDLNEYLEKFDFPCALLQTPEALTLAVRRLCGTLAAQGLLYAEIRFAPQLHTLQGMTQQAVVEAAVAGLDSDGFRANLILCCMRGDGNQAANLETVELAPRWLGRGVCAVDLAGAEALFPTADFEPLFRRAKELGVPYTIHAGEADGPDSVWKALSFGTKRIGHGVRSLEDPALAAHLAAEGVTLELCPTSNLNTSIFEKIADYPLRQFLAAGVKVTVNTDNMTVSGVTLRSEFDRLTDAFSLTKDEVKTLALNAAHACFADAETKAWLLRQIEDRFA